MSRFTKPGQLIGSFKTEQSYDGLSKMHWSPEHAAPLSQWPEQHLDVSSTTSPPSAHKHDSRGYTTAAGYPWASDDISALTASSLLKRYAEKYSGLELPYERPAPGAYSEPGTFLKSETEPWALGQGMECYPALEALAAGAKVGSASVGLPGTGSVTVVNSNLTSDPGYSGGGSCNGPPSQDYPLSYNSTYLSSGYCLQPSSALPPASLQTTPTLVSSYNPTYNYTPGCYPHPQTILAAGYSHSHPSASYLPSGLSTPTPLTPRPTMVGGSYGYPSHSLGAGSETGGPLKRKAFEMAEDGEEGGGEGDGLRYRKYGNGHGNGHSKSHGNGHGNDYDIAGSEGQAYKPGKPLVSPPYGGQEEYSPSSGLGGERGGGGEHGFPHQRLAMKMPVSHARSEDPTGGR